MSNKYFSTMPGITFGRTKFNRKSQTKTTFKMGDLIPVYMDDIVIPGSTHSFDLATVIRSNNLNAPLMDSMHLDLYAFFTPYRILFDGTKKVFGENETAAGYPASETTFPVVSCNFSTLQPGSALGDYLGLPVGKNISKNISVLPVRAYRKIYNRYFRDENIIAPAVVPTGAANSTYDNYGLTVFKAAKIHDYFTSCLPYTQKAQSVSIPLGVSAPVRVSNNTASAQGPSFGVRAENNASIPSMSSKNVEVYNTNSLATIGSLYADLTNATAATINQLRFAFQLQKFYERDALYGTRYSEMLQAHFGVIAPDASIQEPEILGHWRLNLAVDEVVSQSGFETPSSQDQNLLGQVAGMSRTGGKGHIFTKSFTEHGIIMVLAVARQSDLTYSEGLECNWLKIHREDFYDPLFANLGLKAIDKSELNVLGSGVFGYNEMWSEYRYKPSHATGLMRPGLVGSIAYWHLGEYFNTSIPTLSSSFIEQSNTNLQRAESVTGTFDFIGDFYFKDVVLNPMPAHSVPGLIDHH